MVIKRVKKTNMYDVFQGLGWKHHTRVAIKGTHVQVIGGTPLERIKLVEISKTIEANHAK